MSAQYNQPGYPQQGGLPPKKGMSGCMIAVLVLLALGFVGAAGAGFAAYKLSQNPDVKKALAVGQEGIRMAQEAQNAPGVSEVRALGCTQALSFDMKRFMDLVNTWDAGTKTALPTVTHVVQCTVRSSAGAPTCDQVAKTYFAAAPNQNGQFAVLVQTTGAQKPECRQLYSATGAPLGEFKGETPTLPQGN